MANEINVSLSLRYANSPTSASMTSSFIADQAGSKYEAGVQTVGLTEENLAKNDVGTIGYIAVRNTDATNYVELGSSTGVYSVKLRAGESCFIPWEGSQVIAKANTATCDCEYLIIEL